MPDRICNPVRKSLYIGRDSQFAQNVSDAVTNPVTLQLPLQATTLPSEAMELPRQGPMLPSEAIELPPQGLMLPSEAMTLNLMAVTSSARTMKTRRQESGTIREDPARHEPKA